MIFLFLILSYLFFKKPIIIKAIWISAPGNFILNDITVGDNHCTADCNFCCTEGFKAGPGWDPITGFGSIDFNQFLVFFANASYSPPTQAPGSKPSSIFDVLINNLIVVIALAAGVGGVALSTAIYFFRQSFCSSAARPTEASKRFLNFCISIYCHFICKMRILLLRFHS